MSTRRAFLSAFLTVAAVSSIEAQSTPPAGAAPAATGSVSMDRAVGQWVNERVAKARELYALNTDQVQRLVEMLTKLTAEEVQYQEHHRATVQSMRAALTDARTDQEVDEPMRKRLTEKFQRQLNGIQAAAPMSYANVFRQLEAMLPAEQVKAAHERIKMKYRDRFPADEKEIEIGNIDAVINPPTGLAPLPGSLGMPQAPAAPTAAATPSTPATPQAPRPPVVSQPQIRNVAPAPTAKPVEAAPPLEQWDAAYQKSAEKFGFSDPQKEKAKSVFEQSLARARAYQEEKASEFQSAAGNPEALKKLNEPIDRIYDQYTQRVNALASLEQKQKADAGETPAQPK